jgi:hypothetical protein
MKPRRAPLDAIRAGFNPSALATSPHADGSISTMPGRASSQFHLMPELTCECVGDY